MFRCGVCDCVITAEEHIKKSGERYVYYRCTNSKGKHKGKQTYINETKLNEAVSNMFSGIKVSEKIAEKVVEALKVQNENNFQVHNKIRTDLVLQQNKLNTGKANLLNTLLDKIIDNDSYLEAKADLEQEALRVSSRLSTLESSEQHFYLTAEYIFALANNAEELFAKANNEEKRRILNIVSSNRLFFNDRVEITLVEPFAALLNLAVENRLEWLTIVCEVRTTFLSYKSVF